MPAGGLAALVGGPATRKILWRLRGGPLRVKGRGTGEGREREGGGENGNKI